MADLAVRLVLEIWQQHSSEEEKWLGKCFVLAVKEGMPLGSCVLQVSSWVCGIKRESEEVNTNIFKTSREKSYRNTNAFRKTTENLPLL